MIVELALASVKTGQPQQLMDLIPKIAEPHDGTAHPVSVLRFGMVNEWLQRKYPPFERRATEYYAALLVEVTSALWRSVEPHILNLRSDGFQPAAMWTGFDIFEHE